jgi:MFS family permease
VPTVRPYLDLLRRPGVMAVVTGHAFGRLTPGMVLLAVILALRSGGYGYAAVGLITGAHQFGVAIGSPFQGRAADILGHRRVLLPDGVVYLAGTVLLAAGIARGWSVIALVATAATTGLASPPLTACVRAVFGTMFRPGREREQAFVLTVANVEFGFLVGPLLTVGLAALLGPGAAVIGAGVAVAIGSVVYASGARVPEVGPHPQLAGTPWGGSFGRVWSSPGLRAMVVVYLGIATTFGSFDLFAASVAEAAGRPNAAGTLISMIAAASLIGGFVYGARVWPGTLRVRMRTTITAFLVVLLALPVVAGELLLVGVVALVLGAIIGPMNVCGFQLTDDVSPPDARAEAQSWIQAAVYLGSAIGGALAGAVIELAGPRGAMLVGFVGVAVARTMLDRSASLRALDTPEPGAVSRTAG